MPCSLYEATLEGLKAALGLDHPNTLLCMHNLASTYLDAGRVADAVSLFQETLDREKAKLGRDHVITLRSMGRLAMAYREAGQLGDAVALLEETYKRRHAALGPGHLHTLMAVNNLGWAYLAVKPANAEPLLNECLAIRAKKAPDDWRTFDARSLLGGSLLGQKKYAEAERYLLEGYEGMNVRKVKIRASDRKRLAEAAVRILRLYDAWNKPDQVARWKAKLGLCDLPTDVFTGP